MKVGKYFSEDEIKCKCGCGQAILDEKLIKMADGLREYIGKPMISHCVNRCKKHNKNVGGVSKSKHITGNAMDFHINGLSNRKLHKICKKLWKNKEILTGGIGFYPWGVHIDTGRYRTWSGK